jgi:hypothetical protein
MKPSTIFWGVLLIVVGAIFLVATFGGLALNDVGKFIFPAILVALGVWVILSWSFTRGKPLETQAISIPLEKASSAVIRFNHGAGKFDLSASDNKDILLEGTCVGGVTQKQSINQGQKQVELSVANGFRWTAWPASNQGLRWNLAASQHIPLQITFKSGADDACLDLTRLNVTDLSVETGASSTRVLLPECSEMIKVRIHSGVSSVKVTVPSQVAARIQVQSGLTGKNIDTKRFLLKGAVYESPGYDTSPKKAEIYIETGVSSITIS